MLPEIPGEVKEPMAFEIFQTTTRDGASFKGSIEACHRWLSKQQDIPQTDLFVAVTIILMNGEGVYCHSEGAFEIRRIAIAAQVLDRACASQDQTET
jgi:hypothetical protein